MNILMLVVLLLICVFSIPLIYNLFDLLGLKILFIINIIMMFITSFKNIELINLNISLSSIFILPLTALLIISSYKIKAKDLKSNIKQILFIITFIIIEIILLSMYQHSVNDTTTSNVINILLYNHKTIIIFPIVLLITMYGTIKCYQYIKKIENNIFIDFVITSICIGILDTVLYTIIVNINVLSINDILKLALSNYLIRIVLSIIYVPVINYILKRKKEQI